MKVRFLRNVIAGDRAFFKGEVYELSQEEVNRLAEFVEVLKQIDEENQSVETKTSQKKKTQ